MIIAELPVEEELRLLDLASYDIMDSGAGDDFNELVELAADICNCPISLITLIDKDRQWFKAKLGTQKTGTERDIAFCSHAILQNEVLTVEDTVEDKRFFDNPLVTGEDNIRFYAGAPIVSASGYNIGTICVLDHSPKKMSAKEEKALRILSNQVSKLLELRKKNAQIRERVTEMIAQKNITIENIIEKQDAENSQVAYKLQEDIAQRLTAILLYVRMAGEQEAKRMEYLQTADDQANKLLDIIRALAYSIEPATTKWLASEILIAEFIEKTTDTFPFTIHLVPAGNHTDSNIKNTLVAIRIIDLWLKMLADKKDITNVIISIRSAEMLEIMIENNGPLLDFDTLKKYSFESSIIERATAVEALIDIAVSPGGHNVFKATFYY